jgi:teichuronic acid biosynthesis glycosyltransferase TuaG
MLKGGYIAFLDSDDRWMPQKLETQLAQFRKENVVFSFSDYTCINEHGSAFRNIQAPMRVGFKH